MLSPINDRFNGLSNIMHLTKDESYRLNQAITEVASFQIQQKNTPLNLNDLPQNKTGFLKIHAKIEHIKTNGKLTVTEIEFLDQINSITRNFEKMILQSLSTGNARDLEEVEELCNALNKLNHEPLLQNKISPELRKELEVLKEKMRSVAENYKDVSLVQKKLESHEQSADLAIESLAAQQKALEQGEAVFSINSDLTLLELFDQLIGFYKTYEHKESLPLYHAELIERLTQEAYTLRFNREEFSSEYQAAVEVEVLKTLQNLHSETSADTDTEPEEEYEALLLELIEAKNKIEMAKAKLDSHIESLNQPEEVTEKLFKEFAALHTQMEGDLSFLENQIKILSEKQTVGFFGRMKISSRGRQVERNVRVMKEVEEDVPKGWGHKLLSVAMWGLYLTPQISAFAQFAGRTYQAVSTGESPLKETAELMSNAAFANQVGELPPEEQQEIDFDVNTIQGVLNGYIPLTETLAENRPEAAEYLEGLQTKSTAIDSQVLNSSANNNIPTPIMSSEEANVHALRYMGSQVRKHYESTGKQLAWESPFGNQDWSSTHISAEEKPRSMFSLFGEECADSIREAKTGVPLEGNTHYQKLQAHVQSVFGVGLPVEWFSEWILTQSWSDERLDNFEDWFAHNLECQVRHHISHQGIHVKTEAPANIPLLLSGAASVESSDKSQPVKEEIKSLPAESRQFKRIDGLADEIYPGNEIFREPEPLTSSASRLTSPFKKAFEVYDFFKNRIRMMLEIDDRTLLHQLGDYFGVNTGLEGHVAIDAMKFYRGLISSLTGKGGEEEHLERMGKILDKAIQLSKFLYNDVNNFQKHLKRELIQLAPGESVFISGGWIGKTAGHAMVYEIIKQTENIFSFRIYNTGSGIEHHVSETVHLKQKIVPYVEISNVSLDKILDRPFLHEWQLLQTEIPEKEWKADDIYLRIMPNLQGEATLITYGEEDLMTPQRSGTCAFMSLHAVFYHLNVDKKISKKIRFQLLGAGIEKYIYWNKGRLSTEPEALNLFTKSVEEYSRIVAALHDDGVVSDDELIKANNRIKEFQQMLDSGKQAYLKAIESDVGKVDLNRRTVDWGRVIPFPQVAFLDPDQPISSQKAPLFYLPSLKDWQPKPDSLIKDLDLFIENFKKGGVDKSHISVSLEIQSLINKLDLTAMVFTKEEASKITAQLHTLGFLYYENIQRSCKQQPDIHCQVIAPKMLLTVNQLLYQAAFLLEKFYPGVPKELARGPFRYITISSNDINSRLMAHHLMRFMDPEIDHDFRKLEKNISQLLDLSSSYTPKLNEKNSFVSTPARFWFDNAEELNRARYMGENIGKYRLNLEKYRIGKKDFEIPDIISVSGKVDEFLFSDISVYKENYQHLRQYYPPELYQLFDLGALSLGFEQLPLSLTSVKDDSPLRIETKNFFDDQRDNLIADSIALFHPINVIDSEYPKIDNENSQRMDGLQIANYHLEQISQKIQDPFLRGILNIKDQSYSRDIQNQFIVVEPKDSVSLQQYRTLTGLATSKKTIIKETLSYFSSHAGLLVNPDYQAFFIHLLFTPGLLLDDLEKSSGQLVARHLSDFSVKNFEFFKSIGDLKTAGFFLHLNRLFKTYVDYADVQPKPFFLDTRDEIRAILAQENLDPAVRWLLNKEMALSYFHDKELSQDQTLELLTAAFSVSSFYNTGYNDEKWGRLEIEGLLQKHTGTFIKLFEGSDGNHLLNMLAGSVSGKSIERQWQANPAYPYFKTVDGDYQIDLASCVLNDDTTQGLPKEYAMHPDVLKMFNNVPPKTGIKAGKNGYVVQFEGNSYRLLPDGDKKIIVQREFEILGKRVWGQFTRTNEDQKAVLPPLLTKTSQIWVCESKPKIMVMTNQKNQVVGYADHHQIYQIDPKTGRETGNILDLTEGRLHLSETLARMEEHGYFALWVDKDTTYPQQIELPRFGPEGLTFTRQIVNGKDRMVSQDFPGFYLAEKQFVKELGDDLAYLLMENASGKKQVIMARQFFIKGSRKADKKALESSKDYLDREIEGPHLSKLSYYLYPINPGTGQLEVTSMEAKFYLSMRFHWKMRYDEAGALLRGFDYSLRPFSKEESEILVNIAELASSSGDSDPRSNALSLYAAYLLEKNNRDFGIISELNTASYYTTYLNQMNNLYDLRLKPEEELFLLSVIAKKNVAMINRLIELDPSQGRWEQATFSNTEDKMDTPVGIEENKTVDTENLATIERNINLMGAKKLSTTNSMFDAFRFASKMEIEKPMFSLKKLIEIFKTYLGNPETNRYVPFFKSYFTNFDRAKIGPAYLKPVLELMKSESLTGSQKEDYEYITGLDFPGEHIDWRKELASSLRLMTRTDSQDSNTLAWILLAYVEHPGEIPLEDLFIEVKEGKTVEESQRIKTEKLNEFKEIYEQTIIPKLLKLYPAIVQLEIPFSPLLKQKKQHSNFDVSASVKDPSRELQFQHSIALRIPSTFTPPVIPALNDLISVNKADIENDISVQSDLTKLEQSFLSIPAKDSIVKREMGRIASSISLYKSAVGDEEEMFSLKSLADLNEYAGTLNETLSHSQMELREQEMLLLSKVNRPSHDLTERAKGEILDVGQARKPLTVDDLIYLYWNRDTERFHKVNPNLTVDEIHELEMGIQTMLVQATHVQQLKRVLQQIALINQDLQSGELHEQLKQLKSLAEGNHAYNFEEHPEYLVLEHYANILLRPEQIQNLDLLQIRDGKIHDRQYLGKAVEMIMGGGKTTVLLPLLAIMNADGDTLSMGILPSALLPSMSGMLAETLGTGFQQMVEVVAIDRETPIDEAFLIRLHNIRKDKKLLLMTDSSLQSLFLNYIEHLHNYSHATKEQRLSMESKHHAFTEIFTLLKERGSVIIDEVDQILNSRTEKQYTLGSAQPLPIHEVELVTALYEILETDAAITGALRFDFSAEASTVDLNAEAKQAFMEKTYETIKPKLIDAIMRKKMGTTDPEAFRFFENLSSDQNKLVKEYLSIQSPNSTAFISKQIPVIKDLLALAKEEIQTLLPLTCVKLSYQNYGPGEKVDYAIPFHGSDTPSLTSQHGTSYETLGYTIQMMIKHGVNPKIIKRELDILRNEALKELKDDPERKLEDTKAHQRFVEMVGGDKTITLFGSDNMLDKIAVKVNSNLKLKLEFIKKYVAPQIKNYEKFLSTNPQMYNFILSILKAFSGTQWNSDGFPEGMEIVPDEIITGKTLGLLWNNRHEPVHIIKTTSAKNIVHELVTSNPQAANANALIDTGGEIRGIPRLQVARQMLDSFQKDRQDIKGIVFYETNNELMSLEIGKSDPILFTASKLKPEERFTFYDQKHTTGSDIKQKPDAIAVVTIGKSTILRDLLQSVWRLRGLDKSQKVQFTINEETNELIFSVLNEIGASLVEPLQLEHIMLFVAYNQAMLQGDNNFRAFKHKTWEVLQNEMFKSFLDPSLDGEQVAELFKSVESLFIRQPSLSPWELFGEPSVLVDSDVALKNHVQKVVGSPAFQILPIVKAEASAAELERLAKKTNPLLPNKIESGSVIYGREVEIETEKEQEKEVEKEVEVEIEVELSKQKYDHNFVVPFNIILLSDAFKATKGMENYADIFDSGLSGSLNFIPIEIESHWYDGERTTPPFGLFNQFQKPVSALRIVSEDEVVMVDQNDADGTLYDLNLGLYQVEESKGKAPGFLNSDKFLRKVVQAKFFNGETHYKKEEIPLLQEWIKEKGVDRIRGLFVKHILKFKDNSRAEFPGSVLDKALRM